MRRPAQLFPDGSVPASLTVTQSAVTTTGLVSLTLCPTGGLAVGDHQVVGGRDTAVV